MTLQDFSDELKKIPLTGGFAEQIEILKTRYGKEYEKVANDLLELFCLLGLDSVKTARRYIYDYLKQMEFFLKNKEYGHSDYKDIKETIYDNEEVMLKTYMPGLLLSYAYTTILYEKNHVFLTGFLSKIVPNGKGVEIGFGEGFYLWETLNNRKDVYMTGFDVSPYAIRFASDFLKMAGIDGNRYRLEWGNVFEGLKMESESADFAIFAEVIEHIPEPEVGLSEVVRLIKKGGILYLTTVKDSNHMDHISNFESTEIVKKMIESQGMRVIEEHIYHMTDDFPESKDISVGITYVAIKE